MVLGDHSLELLAIDWLLKHLLEANVEAALLGILVRVRGQSHDGCLHGWPDF